MKTLRNIFLITLSLFITSYLAFLFIMPRFINLNKYESQIQQLIHDNTDSQVHISGLKVKTCWDLSIGALIDRTDLTDNSGTKFAQINNLQINISLWRLMFKKIKINKFEADKVLANIEPTKWENKKNGVWVNKFSNFTTKFPDLNIKKYRITFIKGDNKYSLKGTDLKISDFELTKKIKLTAKGQLILNGRKQITYNVLICSKVLSENVNEKNAWNFLKIFDELYKYNINANIYTDLNINQKNNENVINGKIDIDKLSFTFAQKTFPESTLKLEFNGDTAKINSSLHVDKNSKALISGSFKTNKRKFIDLQVITDKIQLQDMLLISKAMYRSLGLKELQNINANGFVKANFKLKSDFKKVESSGYLKVTDANITNKLYNVSLTNLNSDVDFSQNFINITRATTKLNGQPITIKGTVDRNAIADVSIQANNLQLKNVLPALNQCKILDGNEVLNGSVNLNAALKGRLDKAVANVNVLVNKVYLRNKKTKTKIMFEKAVLTSNPKDLTKKKVQIKNLKVYPNSFDTISIPTLILDIDNKNLDIEETYLYVNNIKTNLSGRISDLDSNPRLNSINIMIPNSISVPLKGYPGSNAIFKGFLTINGDVNNPKVRGNIIIPSAYIPSAETSLKNMTILFGDKIILNCPQLQIADSSISFNSQIKNEFTNGIIAQNLNFNADNIDLNSLIPIYKKLPNSGGLNLTILSGKSSVARFKIGGINATKITSNISLKNNVLELDNLRGDAYGGKIGGDLKYNIKNGKTYLQLQGRGLSSKPAMIAISGRDDDINGILDFDSNISIKGFTQNEILQSLKGYNNFIISNGKMGILGKFEHLIYAQNIISNNVFKATLNVIAKAITVKNTGVYKYIKGEMTFSNGWTNIIRIKTSGPSMSLYITGRYYIPDNIANLTMLGRISDDVVRILGPVGDFSMNKAVSSISKIGESGSQINQFTTNPTYENVSLIPDLTPKTEFATKEFKVIIDGDAQNQSSIKSFKWLSKPQVNTIEQNQTVYTEEKPQQTQVPDFVKKLPDLKK